MIVEKLDIVEGCGCLLVDMIMETTLQEVVTIINIDHFKKINKWLKKYEK